MINRAEFYIRARLQSNMHVVNIVKILYVLYVLMICRQHHSFLNCLIKEIECEFRDSKKSIENLNLHCKSICSIRAAR